MKFALHLQFGHYFLDLKETHVAKLQKEFLQIEFVNLKKNDDRFPEIIRDVEVLATWPVDPKKFNELLSKAEKLRWIQWSSVGMSLEYLELARRRNWMMTNARGIASESISLHVLSLILAFERKLPMAFQHQIQRKWNHKSFTATEHGFDGVKGKVLGIVGLGSIGTALAEKGHALGMRVWGVKKNPEVKPSFVEGVLPSSRLADLLKKADFLVLALPLLPETTKLIGREELNQMKESAYLINVARGGLIDEAALVESLRENRIAGAALDVAEKEPLAPEHPFYETPNLVLTPHIAGLDRHYTDSLVDLVRENTQLYLQGKPLRNKVNLQLGY